MTLDRKHIDELFQNRIHDFEMNPSPALWDRIDEEMSKLDKKKSRKLLQRFAIAASIAASFALGFFVSQKVANNNNTQTDNQIIAQVEPVENSSKESFTANSTVDNENTNNQEKQLNQTREKALPVFADNNNMTIEKVNTNKDYINTNPERIEPVYDDYAINETEEVAYEQSVDDEILTKEKELPEQNNIQIASLNSLDNQNALATMERNNIPEDPFTLYQDEEEQKKDLDKWSVGGQMAPLYSYRNIETDNLALENNFNENQTGILAYAGGIEVNYKADRRLSIQTGIYYSKIGQSNRGNMVVAKSAAFSSSIIRDAAVGGMPPNEESELYMATSTGNIEPTEANIEMGSNSERNYAAFVQSDYSFYGEGEEVDILQYFEYIEVPVLAKYKVIDRKIDLNILGGISSHLLVGNPIYLNIDGEKEKFGETTGISKFNYSSVVGIGLAYPVTNSLSLSLEPTFKYYLNSFYNDSQNEASFHPYSFGVFTGISYSF